MQYLVAISQTHVTATIRYDRAGAIGNMSGGRPGMGSGRPDMGGGFDFDLSGIMGGGSSLTLEEYLKYAEAESVQLFYYTLTAYLDGSDGFAPVSEDSESSGSSSSGGSFGSGGMFPGGMGGMMGGTRTTGEFSVIGYSSDSAMTAFVNGSALIVEGSMFEEGSGELVCVISEELAMVNGIAVGDTVTVTNPELSSETYTLTVAGIYTSSENNDFSMSMFGSAEDPATQIYMSATALQAILDASKENSVTVTDDNGRERESEMTGTLDATYTFADTDAYYAFENEVRALGLDESYTVSSSDIQAFENSLAPLKTLGTMAGWFLLVILIIGGVILVVLNIFNVRERKYEVGVLTAMGMKKWKVAAQFLCEILVVTMLAVVIGAAIGAVSAVPVTNALLEGQVQNQSNQQNRVDQSFGRPGNMGGGFPGGMSGMPSDLPSNMGGGNPFGDMLGGVFNDAANYITEVDSAMNLTVVLQMIGVGLLLTLIASAASVLFIMRYDPLKILANRD